MISFIFSNNIFFHIVLLLMVIDKKINGWEIDLKLPDGLKQI